MNIWWIAIIAVLVLIEKVAPRGLALGKCAGVLLAVWGVWLMIKP
jgi:predicted metal-binding membrane protein